MHKSLIGRAYHILPRDLFHSPRWSVWERQGDKNLRLSRVSAPAAWEPIWKATFQSLSISPDGRWGKDHGISYLFTRKEPFVGLHIDNIINLNGQLLAIPWFERLLAALPARYIERSPTSKGLHVIVKVDDKRGLRKQRLDFPEAPGLRLELFACQGYLPVTLDTLPQSQKSLACDSGASLRQALEELSPFQPAFPRGRPLSPPSNRSLRCDWRVTN